MTFWRTLCITVMLCASLNAATFSFVYTDPSSFGFNETDSAIPVGGNTGTTLGEQRRNLLEYAAGIWGEYLQSDVPIVITASFEVIAPEKDEDTGEYKGTALAYAGPSYIRSDFTNAPKPNTWYVAALADSLTGVDLSPGNPDMTITVNESVDSNDDVLDGLGFYYGFDDQHGSQTNLLTTLLHEIGHGLGFISFVDEEDGSYFGGQHDSFTCLIHDEESSKDWTDMTNAERMDSAINDPDLVFSGNATTQASQYLLKPIYAGMELEITYPASAATTLTTTPGNFGNGIALWGLKGSVVLVDDGVAPSTDACEEPFINAGELRGRIALIDRGNCNFTDKVKRAQGAGAIAVIIADNVDGGLVTMSGNDSSITIPSAFISLTDGNTLKAALSNDTQVHLRNTVDLEGTQNGFVRLHALDSENENPSASHWSVDTFPDLLMEPFIADSTLPDLDLTPLVLRDIGWRVQNINLPYYDYTTWADEQISVSTNEETEDADNDSWSNLSEYAFGSDPMEASSTPSPTILQPASSNAYGLFYLRNRSAADIIFGLSKTNDLSTTPTDESTGLDFIEHTKTQLDKTTDQVELQFDSTSDNGFYRITAERYAP